jgi:hypothetical protein
MPGAAYVVAEYKDLLSRTEQLVREFQPSLSAGMVISTVTGCRDELMRTGVRRGLATATEVMARARLRTRLADGRQGTCTGTPTSKGWPCPSRAPGPMPTGGSGRAQRAGPDVADALPALRRPAAQADERAGPDAHDMSLNGRPTGHRANVRNTAMIVP